MLLEGGDYSGVLAVLDESLKLDPMSADIWYRRGLALCALERYEEAIECFGRVLELEPDDMAAWHNKGVTLNNLGRPEESALCYDRALELHAIWRYR